MPVWRLLKWTAIVIGALIMLLIASMIFIPSSNIEREDARVSNPSKTMDAVEVWTGGGGAAGWSYTTDYVVPHGKPAVAESRFSPNWITFGIHYPQEQVLVWGDDHNLTIHVICEVIPRESEKATLRAAGQVISVEIVYDDCPRADSRR
jgi:hypothetical protein